MSSASTQMASTKLAEQCHSQEEKSPSQRATVAKSANANTTNPPNRTLRRSTRVAKAVASSKQHREEGESPDKDDCSSDDNSVGSEFSEFKCHGNSEVGYNSEEDGDENNSDIDLKPENSQFWQVFCNSSDAEKEAVRDRFEKAGQLELFETAQRAANEAWEGYSFGSTPEDDSDDNSNNNNVDELSEDGRDDAVEVRGDDESEESNAPDEEEDEDDENTRDPQSNCFEKYFGIKKEVLAAELCLQTPSNDDNNGNDEDDPDYVSPFNSQFCRDRHLGKKVDFMAIILCYKLGMNIEDNDKIANWRRLNEIVEQVRNPNDPIRHYGGKAQIPLRSRFLQTRTVHTRKFSGCTPLPPFDLIKDVKYMPLTDDIKVIHALPYIRELADATEKATGIREAVLPRWKSIGHSSIIKNFYESNCKLALIGKGICLLKERAKISDSYIADSILSFFAENASLVLNNDTVFREYHGRRQVDAETALVNCHFAVLYDVAGLDHLPNMQRYSMEQVKKDIVGRIRSHENYIALAQLRELQAQLVNELSSSENIEKINDFCATGSNKTASTKFKIAKILLGGEGSTCRFCDAEGVPRNHRCRLLPLSELAHIGEAGRNVKRVVAGGRQPSKCTFVQLVQQDAHLELLCNEDHKITDFTTIVKILTGELDISETHYNRSMIYRYKILCEVMLELTGGTCQFDPDYKLDMQKMPALDIHHLTMTLNYIDSNGKEWDTAKSRLLFDKAFTNHVMELPNDEWQDFMVKQLAISVISRASAHRLLHLVFGPNKVRGLIEHLNITIPWNETSTHIEMPRTASEVDLPVNEATAAVAVNESDDEDVAYSVDACVENEEPPTLEQDSHELCSYDDIDNVEDDSACFNYEESVIEAEEAAIAPRQFSNNASTATQPVPRYTLGPSKRKVETLLEKMNKRQRMITPGAQGSHTLGVRPTKSQSLLGGQKKFVSPMLRSSSLHRQAQGHGAVPTLGVRPTKSQSLLGGQKKFVSPMLRSSSLHRQAQGHGAVPTLGVRPTKSQSLLGGQKKFVSPVVNRKD